LHPLAELLLVVEKVGDVGLGVLELRAPEEGVERAHLDADPAVHAQGVIDVEAVEGADAAGLAAGSPRRRLFLVTLDVDAPVRARAGAQHADSAVALVQGDDTPGPDRRRFLLVRVLDRGRSTAEAPGRDGVGELLEGDPEALQHTGYEFGHQNITLKVA